MGKRMKEHVADPDTTPLLIFPEGTCVNNEYCVMFKRGAFDLGAVRHTAEQRCLQSCSWQAIEVLLQTFTVRPCVCRWCVL